MTTCTEYDSVSNKTITVVTESLHVTVVTCRGSYRVIQELYFYFGRRKYELNDQESLVMYGYYFLTMYFFF